MLAPGDHPVCLSSFRLGGVFTIAPVASVAVRLPQTAMYSAAALLGARTDPARVNQGSSECLALPARIAG